MDLAVTARSIQGIGKKSIRPVPEPRKLERLQCLPTTWLDCVLEPLISILESRDIDNRIVVDRGRPSGW